MMKWPFWILFVSAILILVCCDDDDSPGPEPMAPTDLTHIPYNPVAVTTPKPFGFQEMQIPSDNPSTEAGIALGRMLFFDPILSADSTMSCNSCHLPSKSFADDLATSEGIDGISGRRSSMSLINIGFTNSELFWDGRAPTLESQALLPVEDPIELHHMWPELVSQLKVHPDYPAHFRRAFGIDNSDEITKELAAKAIAQFERILVSADAKFDRVKKGVESFTEEEERGFDMFFDRMPYVVPDAECGHCHNEPLFTTNQYFNNGIEEVNSLEDFPDLGRGEFTGKRLDNGRFRAPALRNIELTAPYMHDGRFQTLDEVLDHYNSGGHFAENIDPLIRELLLSEDNKKDIILFLKTLTDTSFLSNPAYQNPFD